MQSKRTKAQPPRWFARLASGAEDQSVTIRGATAKKRKVTPLWKFVSEKFSQAAKGTNR